MADDWVLERMLCYRGVVDHSSFKGQSSLLSYVCMWKEDCFGSETRKWSNHKLNLYVFEKKRLSRVYRVTR